MKRMRFGLLLALIVGVSLLSGAAGGAATKYIRPRAGALDSGPYKARVLHSFSGVGTEGALPVGGLLLDSAGNLYGATENGGDGPGLDNSCGTIFKITPPIAGQTLWTETVLHVFSLAEGCLPVGDLIMDSSGALYGTTSTGGAQGCWAGSGCGLVFKLSPPTSGASAWSESVVYAFSGADGDGPAGGVVADAGGALYGMTAHGGDYGCFGAQYSGGCGVVYRLIPPSAGKANWTQSVLHAFASVPDGAAPSGGLLVTRSAIYGTTTIGGNIPGGTGRGSGSVFRLIPPPAGGTGWSETVLHSFAGLDGSGPAGNLIIDARGNLYGTTTFGGSPAARSDGTIFEVSPPAAGQPAWTQTVLHSFLYTPPYGTSADGQNPLGLCIEGGKIYGTTSGGGTVGVGTYYQLTPPSAGQPAWTETVLHSFRGSDAEGPAGRLIADGLGSLYGLGNSGGALNNNGTAFKLTRW